MIKIGNDISRFSSYSCQPNTREELMNIIFERIKRNGTGCDLNDIDISLVKDMTYLFAWSFFNGDISKWDTSHVINMDGMFNTTKFNGDISNWDVRNVRDMSWMFYDSKFTGDISNWNVSKVKDIV